ncbi:hypothetical protein WG66_000893, partial [Moniliophthora roreri]
MDHHDVYICSQVLTGSWLARTPLEEDTKASQDDRHVGNTLELISAGTGLFGCASATKMESCIVEDSSLFASQRLPYQSLGRDPVCDPEICTKYINFRAD